MALQQKSGERPSRPLNTEGRAMISDLADSITKQFPP